MQGTHDYVKVKVPCLLFQGTCDGDSGGPLYAYDDDNRQTLVGVTSGGLGCGTDIPNWYTRNMLKNLFLHNFRDC